MHRVEFRLTDAELIMLDGVALDTKAPLQPHHAAVAGHRWDRKAALVFLLRRYYGYQDETETNSP